MHNHEVVYFLSEKQDNGSFATIKSEQAAIEVAEKIQSLVDEYGPRSVAIYVGMNVDLPAAAGTGNAFYVLLVPECFF